MRNGESTCGFAGDSARAPRGATTSSAAGETDDVEVVAVDPLDEPPAEALDRVRAGSPLPLPARDVRLDDCSGESTRNVTSVSSCATTSSSAAEQADAGDDRVRAAGQLVEHVRRRRRVGGLAVDATVERTVVSTPSVTRPSRWTERALPSACARTSSAGSASGGSSSTYSGATTSNGIRELLEDRAPLRARGRERQTRGSSREVPADLDV